jgi:hypothetical protein
MTFTTNPFQTPNVTNTGAGGATAESFLETVSTPASGAPSVKVSTCAVAWVATKCSGGARTQFGGTLAVKSSTTITFAVALAGGVVQYLKVEPAAVPVSWTVTVSPRIAAPTRLRRAVTMNQSTPLQATGRGQRDGSIFRCRGRRVPLPHRVMRQRTDIESEAVTSNSVRCHTTFTQR